MPLNTMNLNFTGNPSYPAQGNASEYKHFETLIRLKRNGAIISPYIFMPTRRTLWTL